MIFILERVHIDSNYFFIKSYNKVNLKRYAYNKDTSKECNCIWVIWIQDYRVFLKRDTNIKTLKYEIVIKL